MRYLLELAYDGTRYHGWQKQHNAHSVQTELEAKLKLILGRETDTLGCGRTDTGVHAEQFFVHFDHDQPLLSDQLISRLNKMLPEDIAAYNVYGVGDDFNARFDADYRTYEYRIAQKPDPFMTRYAWYQYGNFNVAEMNRAAAILLGKHDFECFSKVQTQVNNFICDVQEASWRQEGHLLIFRIRANRFLRNMVRAIVGTLFEIGRGRLSVNDLESILASRDRSEAGQSVPAHGLHLTEVHYPDHLIRNNS